MGKGFGEFWSLLGIELGEVEEQFQTLRQRLRLYWSGSSLGTAFGVAFGVASNVLLLVSGCLIFIA